MAAPVRCIHRNISLSNKRWSKPMLGHMIANTFIKPFQSPVFDDPKNYNLDYDDVTFKASDGGLSRAPMTRSLSSPTSAYSAAAPDIPVKEKDWSKAGMKMFAFCAKPSTSTRPVTQC